MNPEKTPKRIGQGMWVVTWVLVLGLLYVLFQDNLEQRHNPNRALALSGSEVVLKRNRAGHYVATGLINEQPVIFLLDTGATSISIPQQVADRIGLVPGHRHQVGTANGVIDVYATDLASVQLGGIRQNNLRGHINPHMDGETVLLGMTFMKHLQLIQQGDTLTLKP